MIELRRLSDLEQLIAWRREVLQCVFGFPPDDALMEANRRFFVYHIADDSHIAVIANVDGAEAGCGAVCYYDEMPSPDNPSGRCAYIMNIYVREAFRHEGIATAIIKYLIEAARNCRCGKIYLETTDMGRDVYAAIGFRDMIDMMKYED